MRLVRWRWLCLLQQQQQQLCRQQLQFLPGAAVPQGALGGPVGCLDELLGEDMPEAGRRPYLLLELRPLSLLPKQMLAATPPTIPWDWTRLATIQILIEYMAGNSVGNLLYYATVGPQDCLSLPAGWFFQEKIGSTDSLGVRVQKLCTRDLDCLNPVFISQSKPNSLLQGAVDFLTLYED